MLIIAMYLAACSGGRGAASQGMGLEAVGGLVVGELPLNGLPALPGPAIGFREVSAVQTRTGEAVYLNSVGAQLDGATAVLASNAGGFEWAMYQFDSAAPPPQLESIEASVASATGYYLGISNYSAGHWQFYGPYSDSHSISLGGEADSFSNGTHSYAVVLVYGGDAVTVDSVSLSIPSPAAPEWAHIYGEDTDDFSNQVDENLQAAAADTGGNVCALSNRRLFNEPDSRWMQLLKYGPGGARAFAKVIGYGEYIEPQGIAVDSTGNIYIAAIEDQLELFKLAPDASLTWAKTYSFDGNTSQLRLALDSEDNLLVCGSNDVFGAPSEYGLAAKFGSDGAFMWAKQWEHAYFFENVELATVGTDVFLLDDNETESANEINYPMLVGLDKDGALIGAKVLTTTGTGQTFGAFTTESITAHGGKVLVGGTTQADIGGEFALLHQYVSLNPDLSVDGWYAGAADLPGALGTELLAMQVSTTGALYMLGVENDETFNLVKFNPDGTMGGAWDITGAAPASVMIVGEYDSDAHRALLAPGPGGSLFVAGSSLDPVGLSLAPGTYASHSYPQAATDISLSLLDLAMTAGDITGVNINDAAGVDDEPGTDDDTLVMRLAL